MHQKENLRSNMRMKCHIKHRNKEDTTLNSENQQLCENVQKLDK